MSQMNRPAIDKRARWYYVSARGRFTCAVVEFEGKIIETAPILKRFMGQPLENLRRWIARLDGKVERL